MCSPTRKIPHHQQQQQNLHDCGQQEYGLSNINTKLGANNVRLDIVDRPSYRRWAERETKKRDGYMKYRNMAKVKAEEMGIYVCVRVYVFLGMGEGPVFVYYDKMCEKNILVFF